MHICILASTLPLNVRLYFMPALEGFYALSVLSEGCHSRILLPWQRWSPLSVGHLDWRPNWIDIML